MRFTRSCPRPAKWLAFIHAQYTNPVEKWKWWQGNYGTWLTFSREVCGCKRDLSIYIQIEKHKWRKEEGDWVERGRLAFSFIVSANACRRKHSPCEQHRLHASTERYLELNWERKKQSYILRLQNTIAIATFLHQRVVLYSYITGEQLQCLHVFVAFKISINTWQMHKKKKSPFDHRTDALRKCCECS